MRVLALSTLALLVTSCATPELDRYDGANFTETTGYRALPDRNPGVQVYAYTPTTPPDPKPGKTKVKDLSDHGQAALIEGAWKASPDEVGKVKALAGANLGESEQAATFALNAASQGRIERTLVIDVSKGLDFAPGDRLSWTLIKIRPIGFEFAGYSVAGTKFETLDVANIKDTSSVEASASVDPTFASDLQGEGSFGLTWGRDRTVTSDVKQRYVDLSVGVQPKLLQITRESERNRDVSGNTFIALSLDYADRLLPGSRPDPGFLVSAPKLVKDGKALPAADASATFSVVSYPQACPLEADITFAYELRKAGKKGRTYVEGDDKAEYVRDTVVSREVLVPADEVRPKLWRIVQQAGAGQPYVIHAAGALGFTQPMLFASFEDARLFTRWMMDRKAVTIGKDGPTFEVNGSPLSAAAYPVLAPQLFAGACTLTPLPLAKAAAHPATP